jgi:hypothetical protein
MLFLAAPLCALELGKHPARSMHRATGATKRSRTQKAHFVARHKMRERDCGGVVIEGRLDDLAWIHAVHTMLGLRQGTLSGFRSG